MLMKVMMMSENQSSWSQAHVTAILDTDETMLRTQVKAAAMPAKWEGRVQFSPYTSHVMGGGEGEGEQ